MTFVVGLTGGIGSGKSAVAELFVQRGAALVDTDAIAHQLTGPHGAAIEPLREAFGDAFITADGALDRARMRSHAFADPAARAQLEALLHPLIRARARDEVAASAAPYVVLAVPLLIESGDWNNRCDRVLVVDCPVGLQRERVRARSALPEQEIDRIIAAQASREARLAVADDVIDNAGERAALVPQVDVLHARYMKFAEREKPASAL
ncbi:dephospho-CoA kinase [Methyloversatilis sp. XJ19-13]|uniref:dephospho-CoA kinase n=1 Tax=Methyloversatilis sp. XJ19-13 TaxID=2963430 RepID=UPI00211C070E|nr:dephospho-CoA kinase [Methyloversatilis sp. XJ19-13]MCQ9372987.1 dephospho-CoA kinase [Methyloversatilis sp. XJ19-13]